MSGPRGASARRWVRHRLPRTRLQPMFERVHDWSLAGMGIGSAVWPLDESGEAAFIERVGSWAAARGDRTVVRCLDVGANHGLYSKLLLDALGPRAEIHCFEPADAAFSLLRAGLGAEPRASLHQVALGRSDGASSLYVVPGHSQLSSLYPVTVDADVQEDVVVRTLDGWASEHGISEISLLKIDVEGAELDVLRGAEQLLGAGAIDMIQFEFGERNLLGGTTLADFFDLVGGSYVMHRIVVDGLVAMPRFSAARNIVVSATNYVAIRSTVLESFSGS